MIEFKCKPRNKKFQDLEGKRFSRWTVLGYAGPSGRATFWWCRCDCGSIRSVDAATLINSTSRSCGCLSAELTRSRSLKHGMSKTIVYRCWQQMLQRCNNPKKLGYANYGARGISVCKRWSCFQKFFSDMGVPPNGMSLERVDNNGNYNPANCVWATYKQQARNTRNTRRFVIEGQLRTLSELVESVGINHSTLRFRLRQGWSIEEALERPVRARRTKLKHV